MSDRTIRTIVQGQTITTTTADTTVIQAACLMRKDKVGALVVLENDKLAGIFTERDALFRVLAAGRDPSTTTVGDVMTCDPQTITPNRPLSHALHLMHEGRYRHMPVVENGYLVGMVSIRDALGQELQKFHTELEDKERLFELLS